MPVTSVSSDPKTLSLTIVGEYPVKVERLWEAYADPRQLERFFGPPGFPVTFTRHDFVVGGLAQWEMNGPDDACYRGWWRFVAIAPPRRIELNDGFSDAGGTPITDSHGRMVLSFESTKTGSRVSVVSYYPNIEIMEQMVVGQSEGGRAAMEQLDAILAEPRAAKE
jgi:uncharacterized protein YndB with AHSA1/START domain